MRSSDTSNRRSREQVHGQSVYLFTRSWLVASGQYVNVPTGRPTLRFSPAVIGCSAWAAVWRSYSDLHRLSERWLSGVCLTPPPGEPLPLAVRLKLPDRYPMTSRP